MSYEEKLEALEKAVKTINGLPSDKAFMYGHIKGRAEYWLQVHGRKVT